MGRTRCRASQRARHARGEWEKALAADCEFHAGKRGARQRAVAVGLPLGGLALFLRQVFVDERQRVGQRGFAKRRERIEVLAAVAARCEQRIKHALGPGAGSCETLLARENARVEKARDLALSAGKVVAAGVKNVEFKLAGIGVEQLNAAGKPARILRRESGIAGYARQRALRNELRTRGIAIDADRRVAHVLRERNVKPAVIAVTARRARESPA